MGVVTVFPVRGREGIWNCNNWLLRLLVRGLHQNLPLDSSVRQKLNPTIIEAYGHLDLTSFSGTDLGEVKAATESLIGQLRVRGPAPAQSPDGDPTADQYEEVLDRLGEFVVMIFGTTRKRPRASIQGEEPVAAGVSHRDESTHRFVVPPWQNGGPGCTVPEHRTPNT
jgi:hypothetical protein